MPIKVENIRKAITNIRQVGQPVSDVKLNVKATAPSEWDSVREYLGKFSPEEVKKVYGTADIEAIVKKNQEMLYGKPISAAPATLGTSFKETRPLRQVPFLGTLESIAKQVPTWQAVSKLSKDKPLTPEDASLIQNEVNKLQRKESIPYKISNVVQDLPAFAGEIALTGGVAKFGETILEQGTRKVVQNIFSRKAAEVAGRAGLTQIASKIIPTAAKKTVAGTVSKVARGLVAGTIQAPVAMSSRMVEKYAQERTPDISIRSDGSIGTTPGKSPSRAVESAAVMGWVETVSERSGGLIQELSKYVPASVINNAFTRAIKKVNPFVKTKKINDLFKTTQWHGVAGEMFEERIADIGYAVTGQEKWALPSSEQLLVELAAFSVPGLVTAPFTYRSEAKKEQAEKAMGEIISKAQQGLEEKRKEWLGAKKVKLESQDVVVPFSDLLKSNITTTSQAGTVREQNTMTEFTGDEHMRATARANRILGEINLVQQQGNIRRKMGFPDLDQTLRNIIVGKILVAERTGNSFNVEGFINELRNQPTIFISGVDKKSALEAQAGIDTGTEAFFSPFMAKTSLKNIATYLVTKNIPLSTVKVSQTEIKDGVNLTEPVFKSFAAEYEKQALLQTNAVNKEVEEAIDDDAKQNASEVVINQGNLTAPKSKDAGGDIATDELVEKLNMAYKENRLRDKIEKSNLPQFIKDAARRYVVFVDKIMDSPGLYQALAGELANKGITEGHAQFFVQREKISPEKYSNKEEFTSYVEGALLRRQREAAEKIDERANDADETGFLQNWAGYRLMAWNSYLDGRAGHNLHDRLFDYFLYDVVTKDLMDDKTVDPTMRSFNRKAVDEVKKYYDQNPNQGGIQKRYESIVVKLATEGRKGTLSKSGEGMFYFFPKNPAVTENSPDALALEELSAKTWCTSRGAAINYISRYDQWVLVRKNGTTAGIEIDGDELRTVTNKFNSEIGPIDDYDDVTAFLSSIAIDWRSDRSLRKAKRAKDRGLTDNSYEESREQERINAQMEEMEDTIIEIATQMQMAEGVRALGADSLTRAIYTLMPNLFAGYSLNDFTFTKRVHSRMWAPVNQEAMDNLLRQNNIPYRHIPAAIYTNIQERRNQYSNAYYVILENKRMNERWKEALEGARWQPRPKSSEGIPFLSNETPYYALWEDDAPNFTAEADVALFQQIAGLTELKLADQMTGARFDTSRKRLIMQSVDYLLGRRELKDKKIAETVGYGAEQTPAEFWAEFYANRNFQYQKLLKEYENLMALGRIILDAGGDFASVAEDPEFCNVPKDIYDAYISLRLEQQLAKDKAFAVRSYGQEMLKKQDEITRLERQLQKEDLSTWQRENMEEGIKYRKSDIESLKRRQKDPQFYRNNNFRDLPYALPVFFRMMADHPELIEYSGREKIESGMYGIERDVPSVPRRKPHWTRQAKNIRRYPTLEKEAMVRKYKFMAGYEERLAGRSGPYYSATSRDILAAYDPVMDKILISLDHVNEEDVIEKVLHEITHRGLAQVANDLGQTQELLNIFRGAKAQLMEAAPELLGTTGHTSLDQLVADYGFDRDDPRGELRLYMELAARWSERFNTEPPKSWYISLLEDLRTWLKRFLGIEFSREDVNRLVSGFVYYGSLDAIPEAMQEGNKYRDPEARVDLQGNTIHGVVTYAVKNYLQTMEDMEEAMTSKATRLSIQERIDEAYSKLYPTRKGVKGLALRLQETTEEIDYLKELISRLKSSDPKEVSVTNGPTNEERLRSAVNRINWLTDAKNPNSYSRLNPQVESLNREIARLTRIAAETSKGIDINDATYKIYHGLLEDLKAGMSDEERGLIGDRDAKSLAKLVADLEKRGTYGVSEAVRGQMVREARELYDDFEVVTEPREEDDDFDEEPSTLSDEDKAVISNYMALQAAMVEATSAGANVGIVKMQYEDRLDAMYRSMTPEQQYGLKAEQNKLFGESVADGSTEATGEYVGITTKKPFTITGTDPVSGLAITVTLVGDYKVKSVMEDGTVRGGISPDAVAYRIGDVLITPDRLKRMLVDNNRIRESGKEAPLEFTYYNPVMFGIDWSARPAYNSQKATSNRGQRKAMKPNEPWIYKRKIKARVLLELMRATKTKDSIMRHIGKLVSPKKTQQLFGRIPKAKPVSQDVVARLYEGKLSVDEAAKVSYDQMFPVDKVIIDIIMRDNPQLKKSDKQYKSELIRQLMSSAGVEFYCKEGDSVNRARTKIGEKHIHEPGQFRNDTNAEAVAFVNRAKYFMQRLGVDEVWMRQIYSVPTSVPLEDYLAQERPEDFFYKMLAHPNVCKDGTLQELLRWVKAEVETPHLNRMMELGILDKADMANNILEGFINRVWRYADTQEVGSMSASRRMGGPLSSAAIESAKYRTYEEYLMATGPWMIQRGPLAPAESQQAGGQGLVPIDDYVAQMQQYVTDSLLTIDQLETLKYLKNIEIAAGYPLVLYEHEVSKKAAAEGITENKWFTKYGYIAAKDAPGLVLWYRGAFQNPYIHQSLYSILETMYGRGASSNTTEMLRNTNEVLTLIRRWKTINPFDTNLIYLAPVLLSLNGKVYKSFAKNLIKTGPKLFSTGAQMLKGEYADAPMSPENDELPLFIELGLVGGQRFEMSLRAAFDAKNLGKFAFSKDRAENIKEFFLTFGGVNAAIFNNLIAQSVYDVTKAEMDSIMSKNPGMNKRQAAKIAVDFINDASLMPNPAIYGRTGPLWSLLFFSRNLVSAPIRILTGAAYGITKLPGVKGTPVEKGIQKAYAFKTGKATQFINPLMHGEKSSGELDTLWKKYAWHLIKVFAAKILINWTIQYAVQSLRGGSPDDKDMFKNPKGYKLSMWLGNRDVNNATYFIEPQYFREVQLLYGLSERPIETIQNKVNIGVGEIIRALSYFRENGAVPPLMRNSQGEIIGGWAIDLSKGVQNLTVPLGVEKQPQLTTDKWLTRAQLGGITLRRGPRAEEGAPISEFGEVKQAGQMRDYILKRARERIRDNYEDPTDVAEELELNPGQLRTIMEGINYPFRTLERRNRRAVEMFSPRTTKRLQIKNIKKNP